MQNQDLIIQLVSMLMGSETPKATIETPKVALGSELIGEYVICRSRNEGINAGTVVALDDTGVILKDARRLWSHKPKDVGTSWYEGVSVSGLSADSKVSCITEKKVIIEDYSLTVCSDEAKKSIEGIEPNGQD